MKELRRTASECDSNKQTNSTHRTPVVVAAIVLTIPLLISLILIISVFFPTSRFAESVDQIMAHFIHIKIGLLSTVKLIVVVLTLAAFSAAWVTNSHRRATTKENGDQQP